MLSGTAAFFVSAAVTELYSKYNNNDFWISIFSILTGFSISVPLFAFLFYLDNKRSRKDKTAHSIVNVVARFGIIYELLKLAVRGINVILIVCFRFILFHNEFSFKGI
jgi:hypothetical protein